MQKQNKQEDMENAFDVFMRNYKNVPGIRALIQLFLFGIFCTIFIVVIYSGSNTREDSNELPMTTEQPTTEPMTAEKGKTYKEILESVYIIDKNYKMDISLGQESYIIEAANIGGDITGYFETNEGTKRFKIEEDKLYEVKLDSKKENKELLHNVDIDFVIPKKLAEWLSANRSTKMIHDSETIYVYSITKNNIDYEVKTYVKEEEIYKIEIINDENSYKIFYN